jgi:hypothetical protein
MAFRPDGYPYVAGRRSNSVLRYQASSGAFAGPVVPPGSGGASSPLDLLFGANGDLLVTSRGTHQVLRYGATPRFAFTVSLAWASAGTTTVNYATAGGMALAGRGYTAVSGALTFAPGQTSQTVVAQALDDGLADPTLALTINRSNPAGGGITPSQGIGTTLDDAKFYVVGGGTSDSTYQYASGGAALGNNALGGGDTAPPGVATTAAGTTEWVAGANKTVYVSNAGGALLGPRSAGGLSSSAALTGVATSGTDLWPVDSSSAAAYTYAGAARRPPGNQPPGHRDRRHVLRGGGRHGAEGLRQPTPGRRADRGRSHSDVWIVDSGTDKVYQYIDRQALVGGPDGRLRVADGGGPLRGQRHLLRPRDRGAVPRQYLHQDRRQRRHRLRLRHPRLAHDGDHHLHQRHGPVPGGHGDLHVRHLGGCEHRGHLGRDYGDDFLQPVPPSGRAGGCPGRPGRGFAGRALQGHRRRDRPRGIPVFPGGTAPHNATGTATYLGRYTGEGTFTLLTLDPATLTGTFTGSFVFVAANGDRLAFNYGATTPRHVHGDADERRQGGGAVRGGLHAGPGGEHRPLRGPHRR